MPLNALNQLDHLVIALYAILVLSAGFIVARFNRQTGDYFKGGGHIPWGLSAISLFISGFSAFMFVGAAGFTYRNGSASIILFSLAAPGYLLGFWIYGRLWRRTRIDTPMEFLTRRFSSGTTYFYTLISVIPNLLVLGIYIYTLCVFIASAFGFQDDVFTFGLFSMTGLQASMLVTGLVLVVYTLLGGLWAVMVTDALQFVVLFLASLIVLPVAYLYLGDGNIAEGISRLIAEAPAGFFSFQLQDRPALFWVAYLVSTVLGYNVNWHIAQRYYCVPDERDTRKMALLCAGLSLLLPLMWILPVMAARVLYPDLGSMWPGLAEPSEAAFVTLALDVLPHGMLGIIVSAIFAATMSSADTMLNWLAAVLTHDAYAPIHTHIRGASPSDRNQLLFAKGCVAVMGLVAIWIAFNMERLGGVFDVYTKTTSLYTAPMFVPVLLGLVITRTPWWSGILSFAFGVVAVVSASLIANVLHGLPANSFASLFLDIDLNFLGMRVTRYELQMLVGALASAAFFLVSVAFNRRTGTYAARIEALERDLATPVFADPDAPVDLRGLRAYRLTGRMTLVIGGMLFLMIFPTLSESNGLLNAVGAALAIGIGGGILWALKRYRKIRDSAS